MMKTRIAVVLLFGAAVLGHAQTPARDAAAPPPVPTGTGVLSGVVKDPEGNPLRRAAVTLNGERLERVTVTDNDGRFAFTSLPAGRFSLEAAKPSYPSMSYGASRPNREGAGITLKDGQQVTTIAFTLARGGVLTGTVYDEHGQPMPGVPLNAWAIHTSLTGERTTEAFDPAGENGVTTDDRGQYRIYDLPPGEYTVGTSWFFSGSRGGGDLRVPSDAEIREAFQALTQGRAPSASGAQAASGPPAPRPTFNYAPVYHPNALNPLNATTIQLGPGEERTGVDIQMVLQQMSRMEALVLNPQGGPAQVRTSFMRRTPVPGSSSISVSSTGPDGRFTRTGLGPGDYVVLAQVEATSTSPGLYALSEFSITGPEPVSVTMALRPALTITGRVVFDGKTAPAPKPAEIAAVYVYALTTGNVHADTSTKTDAGGVMTVTGVIPGEYRFSTQLPATLSPSWMVRSYVVGGRDVTDLPFQVQEGETPSVVVTLTDQISELSGTVTTSSGSASDYYVVVVPSDRTYWPAGRRKLSTRPDADGHYTFRKLPPGEYRIAATTDLQPDDLSDNGALELLVRQSAAVTIGFGEKKVFDFKAGR